MEVISGEKIKLIVTNPTNYEARVMVLLDNSRDAYQINHGYFEQMIPVVVPARGQKEVEL